ncbi:MAG: glycosyltransferase [Lachnospiraceae bacterium]|nr:glycosyltransferase [Lachnospiraceae bacterium]
MGVYNQFNKDILQAAVNSILNQSFSDFEFIIYDDGSFPEAADILKNVATSDPRIKLIGKEVNHGLAFSLNACIKVAKGKYIARMDADDISYPNRLYRQKQFLENHQDISWVGCNIELFDENGVWGERKMPEYPSPNDYLKFSPFAHPTVMYRASIFDKNEGYVDSEEMLRCEDYEIFMRLKSRGLNGANMQEALFAYREDNDSYKKRSFKFRVNEAKCRYRNFKKLGILFPTGWLFVLRPIIACLIPRKVLALIKHIQSANKAESYAEVNVYEKKSISCSRPDTVIVNRGRLHVG